MRQRKSGKTGPEVGELGLGCMGMSDFYGPADRNESLLTLDAALDGGATLLDTGDFYGAGHNELLIAEALRTRRREDVVISVKFGALRDPAGGWTGYDARPAAVKNFLAYSLKRLRSDYVDIYRPARLDPDVPIEDTVGAIGEMVKAGYVRHIGLSEVGAATIRRAAAVHPIADLQIEYSLVARGIEDAILPACRDLGIGITAYGVLARGLISGHWSKEREKAADIQALRLTLRRREPRPQSRAGRGAADGRGRARRRRRRNRDRLGSRPGRRHRAAGRRAKRGQWAESAKALALTLTPGDLDAIERAVPKGAARGERYPAMAMAHLDSETKG